jgi:hypothetical protein
VHPLDDNGDAIPGAHFEILYGAGEEACTAYQIYENVTEGTPVSPVFVTQDEMRSWLRDVGHEPDAIEAFLAQGFAPSFVVSSGAVVDGIAGLPNKKPS